MGQVAPLHLMEQFMKNCILWEVPHPGADEKCEEEEAERELLWTDRNPHSHPSSVTWQGRVRTEGVKQNLQRRGARDSTRDVLVLSLFLASLLYF